jgi:Clostridial binary toxin B/anthrax toxin PA Ca-binding domain
MRQRPHSVFSRFSRRIRRPVALILALMIGWTGVPLDPRILADGYYDGDGNWIEDYSYNPGYTDPGYTDPGYTDPGYTDPGYTDPSYTDPGYTDPGSSSPSYDPWFHASSGIDSDGDGLDDHTEVWGFAIPLITVHSSSTYTETTNPETGETYSIEVPYESVEETSTWISTDPTNHDTDYDGLPDGYERDHELNPTSPYDGQTDDDGDSLNRGLEYHYGTDPFHTDTDHDGFSDFEEVLFLGSDPLDRSDPVPVSVSNPHPVSPDPVDPAAATGEGTSANNVGTAPNPVENNPADTNPETGATALTAEWILWQAQHFAEHLAGDPADPQADGEADPDSDTLTNVEEFLLSTDPLNSDSDQDGMLDGWEVAGLVLHYDRTETPEPPYTPGPGEPGYHGFVYRPYQFQYSTTIYDADYIAEIGVVETWVRSVETYDSIWGLTATTMEYLERTIYYNHQGTHISRGWLGR